MSSAAAALVPECDDLLAEAIQVDGEPETVIGGNPTPARWPRSASPYRSVPGTAHDPA